ncbi:MAG: sugar ABC transporter substrate-binding protein [Candidatus Atribacteria bacterium]|nr:sugar ABC transporter substrate-binding protein [Candidatus Atribacteria bacterium]
MKKISVLLLMVIIMMVFSLTCLAEEWSNYPLQKGEPPVFTSEQLAKMSQEDFLKIAEEIGPETLIGAQGEGKGFKLAFSQRGLAGSEWWENLVRMAKEEAEWLGAEITIIDADRREEKQVTDLLSLLSQKPDALIINPQHPSAVLKALEKYHAANIPIFVVNSDLDPRGKPVCFVSGDSFDMGYKMGWELATECLKRGWNGEIKALEIAGFPGDLVSKYRRLGIVAGFNEYMFQKEGKCHLNIISQQFGNWLPEPSMKITQDVLSAHPDIQVIFAECDGIAQGVVAALEGAGKLGQIIGGSIDGRKQILKRVIDGHWVVDVMQDPRHQGKWVVYFAIQYLKGNTVPHTFYIPTPPATKDVAKKYYHPDSMY